MKSINLMSSGSPEDQKFSNLTKKLTPMAIFLTGLAVLSAAVFMLLLLRTKKIFIDNQQKITALKTSLSSLQKNEYYLLFIDDRTSKIDNLMNLRIINAQLFEDIRPLFVSGFGLLQFSISKGKIILSASCTNSDCLSGLNKKLEELKLNRNFLSVFLSSISKDETGNFLLTLEIKLI